MNEPDDATAPRRSRADRLYERLKNRGASREAIVFALEEDRRRDQAHNAALREKVRSMTAQSNEPNLRADGPAVVSQGASAEASWDARRLTDLRDAIVDIRATLTLVAQRVEGLADGRSVAELSERLTAVSDQLSEEKGTLALLAKEVEGKADGQAVAQLHRLAEVDGKLADASQVLKDTARKMRERAGNDTSSELVEAVAVTRERTQRIFWVLGIGIGIIAPAVVALLALTVWRS